MPTTAHPNKTRAVFPNREVEAAHLLNARASRQNSRITLPVYEIKPKKKNTFVESPKCSVCTYDEYTPTGCRVGQIGCRHQTLVKKKIVFKMEGNCGNVRFAAKTAAAASCPSGSAGFSQRRAHLPVNYVLVSGSKNKQPFFFICRF